MNDSMMDVIEALNKANKRLVEALREAHTDLEDLKGHIASITDPGIARVSQAETAGAREAGVAKEFAKTAVSRADSWLDAGSPYPDSILNVDLYANAVDLLAQLPDNNAVFADRKWRLEWIVREMNRRLELGHDSLEEAQDLATYQKGQTSQYQKNWEELSQACRKFAGYFNRDTMNSLPQKAMDDMLSKCEVASHNT